MSLEAICISKNLKYRTKPCKVSCPRAAEIAIYNLKQQQAGREAAALKFRAKNSDPLALANAQLRLNDKIDALDRHADKINQIKCPLD